MRQSLLSSAAALALGLLSSMAPAAAFDWDRPTPPPGWRGEQTVRHWVYRPLYNHVHYRNSVTDPYAWRWRQPKYYPYYGSRYWVPADQVRHKYRSHAHGPAYVYQPAWGYPAAHSYEDGGHHHPVK